MKLAIAEDLAKMGARKATVCQSESDSDEPLTEHLDKIRLRNDLFHLPLVAKTRSACRAHMQRKTTRFFCKTCNRYLCLGKCWKYYHRRVNYLVNDSNCTGKLIHIHCID